MYTTTHPLATSYVHPYSTGVIRSGVHPFGYSHLAQPYIAQPYYQHPVVSYGPPIV